ncbi:hypothetical protein PHMEG_00022034 [Phytophthora megakarya]|uniref:Reverse transcriptase n=1 Tax=Phytophthora megakarya TaxID=4795 RepID=A0A225VL35_9STRA|nr:hypothetical protein PHMEG_00022034 [Phytophthora megakarya]
MRSYDETAEHFLNEMELTDYAYELAFLRDLTEPDVTNLASSSTVRNPALTEDQLVRLVEVLTKHENIIIASGNALPPPAYGVVCGIDVQKHPPIKQKARRTPLWYLGKLHEILKGCCEPDRPWVSPNVIVLKKNGIDIRLCIDYKMVNAVTAIMEYAMPLVDDLLTDMEGYLWVCLLDAASGFWAIMMSSRDSNVSAFVCALGHFEWLRVPFGIKNAPMIYQRIMDNALWGFVQPKGGWLHYAELMREAEERTRAGQQGGTETTVAHDKPNVRSTFEADREAAAIMDPVSLLVNRPTAHMFKEREADESLLTTYAFVNETFGGCLSKLDQVLQRFTECRISVSFTKIIFVQSRVDFLSHTVSPDSMQADVKKMNSVAVLSFLKTKKGMQSFLGALNYYRRFVQDFAVYAAALRNLNAAKRSFTILQQKVFEAPILRHFDRAKPEHVTLFANEWELSSTLLQNYDEKLHPVRFCGRVLKDVEKNYHLAAKEVLALLRLLKTCYTQLVGRTIHVYTRVSMSNWVHKSKTLFGRTTQFTVMLCRWHLVVTRVNEKDGAFAQLLQARLTSFVDLEDSHEAVTPATKGSQRVRVDPELLYARLLSSYTGFVMSFDGSAKTEKYGGDGSCSWILWGLPEWTIVTAASAFLEATTVNVAEYSRTNNDVAAALDHGAEDLVIVGDSRLAIQQFLGVIACKEDSLMTKLNHHRELTARLNSVRYLHVVREYDAAAGLLASEALDTKTSKVVSDTMSVKTFRVGDV